MAFMVHPQHGATHTHEVAAHESAGWKVSTYEDWLSSKTGAPAVEQTDPGAEQSPAKVRRDRKSAQATDPGAEQ